MKRNHTWLGNFMFGVFEKISVNLLKAAISIRYGGTQDSMAQLQIFITLFTSNLKTYYSWNNLLFFHLIFFFEIGSKSRS